MFYRKNTEGGDIGNDNFWFILYLTYNDSRVQWIFGSYSTLDTQIWQEEAKTYERNKLEIRENNGKSYSIIEKVTIYTMSYSRNVEY